MSRQSTRAVARFDVPDEAALALARSALWSAGWTVLHDVVNIDVIEQLVVEANSLTGQTTAGVSRSSVTDPNGGVLVMNGLDARSDLLFDLARDPATTRIAESLLGKACIPIHSEYFGKPGRGAAATPAHQDHIFYNSHFDDEPAITFWIPLQSVDVGLGALEYGTPCPSQGELLPHRLSPCADFGQELEDASPFEFIAAPVGLGDILVHHSYVVHRSAPMAGEGPRRVFALNFRGSSFRQRLRQELRPT